MSPADAGFWLGLSLGVPLGIALTVLVKAWLIRQLDRFGPAGRD